MFLSGRFRFRGTDLSAERESRRPQCATRRYGLGS